jgi:putative hydrolase
MTGAAAPRVRAFRRAADVVRQTPSEEMTRLARSGGLRSLAGIGDSTEKVIRQALAGEKPEYLVRLEAEAPSEAPLDEAAQLLRQLLRGDCHGHSDWSDGGSPIEEMALAAASLGHEYWSLTDHSGGLRIARGLDAERLARQLDVVDEINSRISGLPFRVLSGIEVDILEDGALDQKEDLLARLDVVVASVHSKLRMAAPEMTQRMLRAVNHPLVSILGHCTGRMVAGRGRPESTFDAAAIFAACVESGTAVEINCRPERLDPPMRLLGQALEAGCLFAIDTDAHAPGQLEWLANGCRRAAAAGVPAHRIVNTRPREEFLAWTHGG